MKMFYRYSHFGTLVLPDHNPRSDFDNGRVKEVYTKVVDGHFDELGTDTAALDLREIRHTGVYYKTNEADLLTALRGAELAKGTPAKLYRVWSDGDVESLDARLVALTADFEPEGFIEDYFVELTFVFRTSDTWTTDTLP